MRSPVYMVISTWWQAQASNRIPGDSQPCEICPALSASKAPMVQLEVGCTPLHPVYALVNLEGGTSMAAVSAMISAKGGLTSTGSTPTLTKHSPPFADLNSQPREYVCE